MNYLIYSMIFIGVITMIVNIKRYVDFIKSMTDVASGLKKRDEVWMKVALVLLIFFLIGYILLGIFGSPDILTGGILFGGSIFVAIVLTLMFRLIDSVKKRSLEIAEVLIGVIDARDPNLNGHSRYVQNLTMVFYKYLPSSYKNHINPVSLEYAALMHDIGKLGVPERILNKPSKLDDNEWKIMKLHPKIGIDILKPLHNFDHISTWIEYHHERVDGKGYYSIPGDQLPVASKIIAITDTYSAITMKRSYKNSKSHEEAVNIMKSVSGTQLDSELLDIFLSIPKNELVACAPKVVELQI